VIYLDFVCCAVAHGLGSVPAQELAVDASHSPGRSTAADEGPGSPARVSLWVKAEHLEKRDEG